MTFSINKKLSYESVDDKNIYEIIRTIRNGIEYSLFKNLAANSPFTPEEWSDYLHISERTLQRYKKEKKRFDSPQSERIVQIILLLRLGVNVFGSSKKFNIWLEAENVALGKVRPKHLLDNAFGINLIKDELTRIEHGVLA